MVLLWVQVSWDVTLCSLFGASHQWCAQEFCSGGVQQIQLRTEDRQNRDLGAVAP